MGDRVSDIKNKMISNEEACSAFKVCEAKENKSNQSNCCTHLKQNIMWMERVILILICVAVAGGFTVPIIIYAVDTDRGYTISRSIELDVDNCKISTSDVQENFTSVLSLYNDMCVEYSGMCTEHLKQLDSKNNYSLYTLTLNGVSKDDVSTFVDYLNQYSAIIRKQCHDVVIPFLCQYVFPPCNVSGGNVSIISKTQCTNIRDALCSVEWNVAIRTSPSAASLLPNCENFNDDDNDSNALPITPIEPQSLQCHYQFKEYCGLCLPLCGKFSQYQVQTKFQTRSVFIFTGTAAFIGGILVFIASAYRRKAMFDFPSVYVVYSTVCAFVIACFLLITYLGGQERLYCTDERLDIAYDNPSAFCQISGFAFHWASMMIAVLWLLHLIHLFMKIVFPIWSRKLDRKQTKNILHVVEVVGALFLCSLAPMFNVILSKYQFGRFPPLTCVPSKEVGFYAICLPLCIILGTGVILAIIMFWILYKRRQLLEGKKSKYFYIISFSIPEVKILIILCYVIPFGTIALINFSINIRDADIIWDRLLDYFVCQSFGYSADHTCSAEYDELRSYLQPELDSIRFVMLGLFPWLNLLFTVQVSDIKKAIKNVLYLYCSCDSKDKTLSDSTQNTNNQ